MSPLLPPLARLDRLPALLERTSRPSERTPGIARHGRLARPRPARALLSLIGLSLAVLLVSGGSVAALATGSLNAQIRSVSLGSKDDGIAARTAIGAIKGGANILLAGSDTRAGQTQVSAGVADGSRNDVTILIHLSADHQQLTAISFPRDLIVDIPACTGTQGTTFPPMAEQQFNTTLGEGLGCTVASVESLTGVTIPYAAEITFDGVIEMSNAIGGVDVCVAAPIHDRDTGLALAAGTHTLEGVQALQFLRTRHGVGDGSDLARISSQQVFLSAMMRKIISGGSLRNPVSLYGLASAAVKNMTLSTSLRSPQTLVELGLALKGIKLSNVLFVQYPTVPDPRNHARVVPNQTVAALLNSDLQKDQKFALSAGSTGRGSETQGQTTPGSGAAGASSPAATPRPSGPAGAATPAPTPSAPATLPSSVTGQSASEQTCSVGNG